MPVREPDIGIHWSVKSYKLAPICLRTACSHLRSTNTWLTSVAKSPPTSTPKNEYVAEAPYSPLTYRSHFGIFCHAPTLRLMESDSKAPVNTDCLKLYTQNLSADIYRSALSDLAHRLKPACMIWSDLIFTEPYSNQSDRTGISNWAKADSARWP